MKNPCVKTQRQSIFSTTFSPLQMCISNFFANTGVPLMIHQAECLSSISHGTRPLSITTFASHRYRNFFAIATSHHDFRRNSVIPTRIASGMIGGGMESGFIFRNSRFMPALMCSANFLSINYSS